MSHPFIKGLDLGELFYSEAVRPLLEQYFPGLAYSAALLGPGSDVLGFDTPQSTDHDWGPRLMLFLADVDHSIYRDQIDEMLRVKLTAEIHGHPVDMAYRNASRPVARDGVEGINHSISILTIRSFFQHILNYDPSGEPTIIEWLTFPEQSLRSITAGRVYHDGLGELEAIRSKLQYYPYDLWLYMLSAQWTRIGQEEHFMGRCGQVGDELGSRLVAARMVRDLMRLCFLMEREYAPYIKWFGSAFSELKCAAQMRPILQNVLEVSSWQDREKFLSQAYEFAAQMHNGLGITEPLPSTVTSFYNRPFLVIQAGRFAEAIRSAIADPQVLTLPEYLGSVDQYLDSTDALNYPERFRNIYNFDMSLG